MSLQIIKDGNGGNTGVFIPMSDWEKLTQKHRDLKDMLPTEPIEKKKLSQYAGTISHETAKAMLKHVEESRNEWGDRLKKQFD